MDRSTAHLNHSPWSESAAPPTTTATLVATFVCIFLAHQALSSLEVQDRLWNALVALVPTRLLLDPSTRAAQTTADGDTGAHIHAAKSQALREAMTARGGAFRTAVGFAHRARALSISGSTSSPFKLGNGTDAPPGLGNWDNSCYQNSILQGLAALPALRMYLSRPSSLGNAKSPNTTDTLRDTIHELNDVRNNGRKLWTPAKLKSMSSWQQQDAQEYFSKIMDEIDKEARKTKSAGEGLESATKEVTMNEVTITEEHHNPLEGLIAQRVACTRCGFSEGISMIPFNCMTVPLGPHPDYDLKSCIDKYTELEEIGEVNCVKCTLLQAESQLNQLVKKLGASSQTSTNSEPPSTAQDLFLKATQRLEAVQKAIEEEDYSDRTVSQTCQIPKAAHASSTKTRQAVIGRAPQNLVVHVNRSIFDEHTGMQRKNYANVRFNSVLDLSPWMIDGGWTANDVKNESDPIREASISMLARLNPEHATLYSLKAVVTHFGRHENGHYIAYRQHVASPTDGETGDVSTAEVAKMKWWRLSDEDVSSVSDAEILDQGGIFMLFYERVPLDLPRSALPCSDVSAVEELGVVEVQPAVAEQSDDTNTSELKSSSPRSESAGSSTSDPNEKIAVQRKPSAKPLRRLDQPRTPTPRKDPFNAAMRTMLTI